MQFINTLTVLALVVVSFALIVAVPVLFASTEDSGRSNRLILFGRGWCHDECSTNGLSWPHLKDVLQM
jgi:photosystem II PsbZ protein